jgi:hypothetical protein
MGLREYLARMDGPDPITALDCLESDLEFLLALPTGHVTGKSRQDFADYISQRKPVDRVHKVLRFETDGDTEFVYGVVTEQGQFIGAFLGAAVLAASGRMRRYQSFFTTEFQLLEWPTP